MHRRTSQCLIAMFSLVAAMFYPSVTHAAASVRHAGAPASWSRPVVRVVTAAHTAAHTRQTRWYTVRPGDTLSRVARQQFGHASWWPGLWAVNRHWVHNPNVVTAGETLHLAARPLTGYESHLLHQLMNPAPAHRTASVAVSAARHHNWHCGDGDDDGLGDMSCQKLFGHRTSRPVHHAPARTASYTAPAARYTGSSGMQQCIIAAESGGNPDIWNASGHWGLYQFSESTWVAHGGSPGSFGSASVAEQNQVFYNTVAADGYSDWTPYDSC